MRVRGQTRPTAELAYDDAALARRRPPRSARTLTIGGACDLVLQDLDARERAAGTTRWYMGQRKTLLGYYRADAPLDSLDATELQAWFTRRREQVSPATLWHHLRFLRRVFRLASRSGWSGTSPLARVVLPAAPARRPDVFGWQEALDLIAQARGAVTHRIDDGVGTPCRRPLHRLGARDADLLELTLRTGLRRSEISRLRLEDLDARAKLLHVRGKRGPRTIPLVDQTVECIQRLLQPLTAGRPVQQQQLTPERISRIFGRWRRRLGEPRLHPHAFRHTLATELVRRGTPLATVARILGHAPGSFAITLRYYSASEPSLRDAIEAL